MEAYRLAGNLCHPVEGRSPVQDWEVRRVSGVAEVEVRLQRVEPEVWVHRCLVLVLVRDHWALEVDHLDHHGQQAERELAEDLRLGYHSFPQL